MKIIPLKVARIGNSRGIRIPATTLQRYHIGESVLMEEHVEGILLRPRRAASDKLSWSDTAREMAAASEDWSAWDISSADGLEDIPWEPVRVSRVAESTPTYPMRRKPKIK